MFYKTFQLKSIRMWHPYRQFHWEETMHVILRTLAYRVVHLTYIFNTYRSGVPAYFHILI